MIERKRKIERERKRERKRGGRKLKQKRSYFER